MSVKDLDMLSISGEPGLLIISSVLPFPRNAGQQQRVYYTLKALSETFRHTFNGGSQNRYHTDRL